MALLPIDAWRYRLFWLLPDFFEYCQDFSSIFLIEQPDFVFRLAGFDRIATWEEAEA
jgi:hypothetical protein